MINNSPEMPFLDDFLNSLELFGIKPGLESTRQLMKLSGSPDLRLKFIHIAGTNGKGSTGAMLERMLRTVGFKTGFYSSPHLLSVTERIRVNGFAANPRQLDQTALELSKQAEVLRSQGTPITYFEFTTVLAAQYFAQEEVDFVIWETGMGGRLDATNVVDPELCIITNIALDHVKYLGNTLSAISAEKAGIIKPQKPVFCSQIADEAMEVISRRAKELGSPLKTSPPPPEECQITWQNNRPLQQFKYLGHQIELGLPGAMQRANFMIAVQVIEFMSKQYGFDFAKALSGLPNVKWPGRIHHLPNRMILDGGHNPDGAEALLKSIKEMYPDVRFWIIFANFQDKDTLSTLKILAQVAKGFIFTALDYHYRGSCSPESLSEKLRTFSQLPYENASSVAQALKQGEAKQKDGSQVFIAGSLYLVGEVLNELKLADEALNI